jgi:hypothetical protein
MAKAYLLVRLENCILEEECKEKKNNLEIASVQSFLTLRILSLFTLRSCNVYCESSLF